jgi:hypothetical protein
MFFYVLITFPWTTWRTSRARRVFSCRLAFRGVSADLSGMDTTTRPDLPEDHQPEIAPLAAPLHVAVAPGLLDLEHTVDREPGESDERYQSRCDLWGAVFDYAKRA